MPRTSVCTGNAKFEFLKFHLRGLGLEMGEARLAGILTERK